MISREKLMIILIILISSPLEMFSQTWEELERRRELDFTIVLDKQEYLVKEPIWTHYLIKNTTEVRIPAINPKSDKLSDLFIVDQYGDTVRYKQSMLCELLLPPKKAPYLEPGEFWYVCRDINYDLKPGRYTVQILYPVYCNFYMKYYNDDIDHVRWRSYADFVREVRNTGDIMSNSFTFTVKMPESEEDRRAFEIVSEALIDFENRNRDKHDEKMRSLIDNFPGHPYSAIALGRMESIAENRKEYDIYFNLLLKYFPNTRYTYSQIHSRATGMDSNERKAFFNRLRQQHQGQWIEKYLDQEERRFTEAESWGWHKDWQQEQKDKLLEKRNPR